MNMLLFSKRHKIEKELKNIQAHIDEIYYVKDNLIIISHEPEKVIEICDEIDKSVAEIRRVATQENIEW